jgi:hypothetical protein
METEGGTIWDSKKDLRSMGPSKGQITGITDGAWLKQ